jgi:hypothetical protein
MKLKGEGKEEEINRVEVRQAQMLPPAVADSQVLVDSLRAFALSLFNSPFWGKGRRSRAWDKGPLTSSWKSLY